MKYEIRYLPLASKDLSNIVSYIADELKAPKAATDLIDALDTSISRLAQFPYSCRVYYPEKSLENEYRVLPVKNYLGVHSKITYLPVKNFYHRINYQNNLYSKKYI